MDKWAVIVSYGYSFCCYAVATVVVACQTIVVASYLSSYFCYALVVEVAVILSANGYYLHSLGAIIKTDLRNANPFFLTTSTVTVGIVRSITLITATVVLISTTIANLNFIECTLTAI